MDKNPYENIPSLDIEIGYEEEEKPKVGKPSILLFIFSMLFIGINFILNLLIGTPDPPEYMSTDAKIAYLKSWIYSPLYLPFVVLLLSQLFRVFRNNKARVKVLFWVSLFFMVGVLGKFL